MNNLARSNATGLGTVVSPVKQSAEVIGTVYAAVYVLMALSAIVVWVLVPAEKTPDIVKNLATVSLVMFVPIIKAFFTQ